MYSDREYDYYGSRMNRTIPRVVRDKRPSKRTIITARDSRGNITFHSENKGRLNNLIIAGILRGWCVNTDKEKVEIQYI